MRATLATLVFLSASSLSVSAYYGVDTDPDGTAFTEGERAVEPRDGLTAVTTSQYGDNFLVAFAPNGSVLYYDDQYAVYDEVEHVPGTSATVVYVATRNLDRRGCHATTRCNRNVIERVNLSTGERERLHERVNPRSRNQWHAIDPIDENRVLVGDIAYDRVFVLDTETGLIEWEWEAQQEFPLSGGGIYPGDWTHLNDVEYLGDGRMMVSLRNQDQVVFLDVEEGLREDWTLGSDDDHDTLYEQHNPQYIPESGGGPAVLVADSENNRILEYRREDGEWERSWEWSDVHMQWPRDADRLPNGHTLVVDSNGARVIELDRSGEIVWQVDLKGAYDVEHVPTGDGHGTPETADRLGLPDRSDGDASPREAVAEPRRTPKRSLTVLKAVLPGPVLNGLLYVLPQWFGLVELGTALLGTTTAAGWGVLELRWLGYRIRSPVVRVR
ncbi:arylsulfotransferase family protein [Halorarum salinum]|uniref:Aryl-sulfate sulfotransferase n=1 Tax=Halorarum salinum TaxID=2743089 RepID=A0A7D5L9R9_9EURY|nr:arylsulfotransferase family protein [Halobaculum salinum]QLG61454.1 aryl-sulfate sulfotransferase [Halobaculum salinum]